MPETAFIKAMVVTLSCAGMAWFGWSFSDQPMRHISWEMDDRRLAIAAFCVSLIGAFFYFQLSRLPEEIKGASLYTGLPVAYLFFAKLLNYEIRHVGDLLHADPIAPRLRNRRVLLPFLHRSHRVHGPARRRVEFLLVILLAIWFCKRAAIRKSLPWRECSPAPC